MAQSDWLNGVLQPCATTMASLLFYLNRLTRRPRFPGTAPIFGGLSPAGGVPRNVPVVIVDYNFNSVAL